MTEDTLGYVQVYTGDGKGKTTAALGLAVRAALAGTRVFIGQFMKGQDYSELALERLDFAGISGGSIEIAQYGTPRFVCKGESPQADDFEKAHAGLAILEEKLAAGRHGLVVADEICVTLHFGLLELAEVLSFLDARPKHVELVLTGRGAPAELVDRADLVTEMQEVKHYYARGVLARKGIEF